MKAPFFKFSPSDWLAGIIQSVGYAERGIFIELCARIWNGGEVRRGDKLARLLRIDPAELDAALDELAELDIITIDEDGNIGVKFLAEQREEIDEVSAIRAEMGRRSGEARRNKNSTESNKKEQKFNKNEQTRTNVEQKRTNANNKEKEKEEDKIKRETLLTEGKEKVAAEADAFSAAAEKESFVESSLKPTADFGKWSEEQFRRSVSEALEKHPEYKSAVDAFSRYWLEPDRKGKYRFALEKTWSTAGRLATWYARECQRGGIQPQITGWNRDPKTGIVIGTADEESYAEWKRNGGF